METKATNEAKWRNATESRIHEGVSRDWVANRNRGGGLVEGERVPARALLDALYASRERGLAGEDERLEADPPRAASEGTPRKSPRVTGQRYPPPRRRP